MHKVEVNGFSAEVLPNTPHVRMVFRALVRRLYALQSELAQKHNVDEVDIDMAVADYAALCARVHLLKSTGKTALDFGIVRPTDDTETLKREFEAYLFTAHFGFVQAIERAANQLDAPMTPVEQQPNAEIDDPNS